jgi:hypothetical protein
VVNFNPAGLAAGTYHGTIAIQVTSPVNGSTTQEIDVPVSLTVPAIDPGVANHATSSIKSRM